MLGKEQDDVVRWVSTWGRQGKALGEVVRWVSDAGVREGAGEARGGTGVVKVVGVGG